MVTNYTAAELKRERRICANTKACAKHDRCMCVERTAFLDLKFKTEMDKACYLADSVEPDAGIIAQLDALLAHLNARLASIS